MKGEFWTSGVIFKDQEVVGPCRLAALRTKENGQEKIVPVAVHGNEGAANKSGNFELLIDGAKTRIPIELDHGNWISEGKFQEYLNLHRTQRQAKPKVSATVMAKAQQLREANISPRTKQAVQPHKDKDRELER